MSQAALHRFSMTAPDDMAGLLDAIHGDLVDPLRITSVWMKTAGNGLRNDHSRALADLALRTVIMGCTGESLERLRDRILILASGGSEGVVSPHMVVVTMASSAGPQTGLVVGTANGAVTPAEIGGPAHVMTTAAQIAEALAEAELEPEHCGLVLIRTPTDPARPGQDGAARSAAALGAAMALNEASGQTASALLARPDAHATRAFVVARHDGARQQVLVLGMAPGGNPGFAIASGVLRDPIDSPGVAAILGHLGLRAAPQLSAEQTERVLAVISKGDAPPDGRIRGFPHVMYADNDVAMHRHARAAYGTLLASCIGHTACLVSGGAERQAPPGGGFASIITTTGRG